MAVSYASNRVTINGSHKSGTTTAAASGSSFQITSGEITSADVGRLVALVPSATDSSQTQVRRIEGVSGTTVTVHDDWVGTIASGTAWRVAHNLEDVHAIGNASLKKIGEKSYQWNGDWLMTSQAFLGDLDVSLEMISQITSSNFDAHWKMNDGCIVQFGLLWGGENNDASETTNGCHISLRTNANMSNIYSKSNSRSQNGPIVNYYGSLINSYNVLGGATDFLFQRMRGPTRFIRCTLDGIMGGRFYHEASEWIKCTITGNVETIPAYSLGVSFDRDIDGCEWLQNLVAVKSIATFVGTFRNCLFEESNQDIFFVNGSNSSAIINFVDCTTIDDDKIIDSGSNTLRQSKSVNYVTTDSSGASLSGVAIRINDVNDNTQSSVQASDAQGVVPEILARFRDWVNASPSISFAPFRIRIRKFGNFWTSLASDIADPIRQSFALREDENVTQSEAVAQAHSGITVTDHGGSPVSWNGLNWGITVTSTSGASADDIKHYLHYHLAQSAAFEGKASGLDWHNMLPMGLNESQNGDYGGTVKGVRVVDGSGDPIAGFDRFQSDDGSYYVPPSSALVTLEGLIAGSEIRAYTGTDPATAVEIGGIESSGTSFSFSQTATGIDGYIVVFALGYIAQRIPITYSAADATLPIQQQIDRQYGNA